MPQEPAYGPVMSSTSDIEPGANVPPALFAFFEAMPRQGPGSATVTRALLDRFRDQLPSEPVAADMGCGNGAAGLVLAASGAQVTGIDIHQPFLDQFAAAAADRGLGDRVVTRRASMTASGLDRASLDLVWSEGAVFTVGFDTALAAFEPLLRSGGLVVVSECVWLQAHVPDTLRAFWDRNYPNMRTVGGNIRAAEGAGYRFLHAELLPAAVWEAEFYQPMERLMSKQAAGAAPDLIELFREQRDEMDMFRRFHHLFGYVFHLFVKP